MTHAEERIVARIEALRPSLARPIVVALDGGSGAGKSTIAEGLARRLGIAVVPLDDFYQTKIAESEWPRRSVAERLAGVFDWERVHRDALEPLRRGEPGRWHAFDFVRGLGENGTYRLKDEATEVAPRPVILLEGAYSASPPLRDLIDLAVLIHVPIGVRHHRIAAREQGGGESTVDWIFDWHAIWDAVETHYFEEVCPPHSFDLVVSNDHDADLAPRE